MRPRQNKSHRADSYRRKETVIIAAAAVEAGKWDVIKWLFKIFLKAVFRRNMFQALSRLYFGCHTWKFFSWKFSLQKQLVCNEKLLSLTPIHSFQNEQCWLDKSSFAHANARTHTHTHAPTHTHTHKPASAHALSHTTFSFSFMQTRVCGTPEKRCESDRMNACG